MGRTEHYNDPSAPKPNSLVPASNLLVVNDVGEILMMQRSDTGQWAIPGGKQEFGESAADCAIREGEEETGVLAEITGFLGVYSNPNHIVAYADGETRQQYEAAYIGRPTDRRRAPRQRGSPRRPLDPPRRPRFLRRPSQHAGTDRPLPGRNLPLPGIAHHPRHRSCRRGAGVNPLPDLGA